MIVAAITVHGVIMQKEDRHVSRYEVSGNYAIES